MQIEGLINNKDDRKTVIVLGNFDGVHIGHQKLIEKAIKISKENNILSSALIFKTHTKALNSFRFQELTPYKLKCDIIFDYGINKIFTVDFDKCFMQIEAKDFLDLLTKNLNIDHIVVGSDYRFGKDREGDINTLKDFCNALDIKLSIVEDIKIDGQKISSTLIRDYISMGDIKQANRLLGRDYMIEGEVVHGKGLGREMGFATANLNITDNFLIPKNGVYATFVNLDDKIYDSVSSVGMNLTFNEIDLRIESHILNFDKMIYGKMLKLYFKDYIRPMVKFENRDKLIEQMDRDTKYFENNKRF